MDLCSLDLCDCGNVQTAHHIRHYYTKFKPPCHVYGVGNPVLLEYLVESKF